MEQDVNQIGEFHKNHGPNIVLLEEGTVAYRKKDVVYGVVFTKYPIGIGGLFEVKIEEINQRYYTGLGIGMTVECPDEIQQLPSSSLGWRDSRNYWILDSSHVYHHGREKKVQFNTWRLNVGDTIALSVDNDGNIHYYVNGIDRGVCWDKLPTNQAMYGVVDVNGHHNKIRSLFHYAFLPKNIQAEVLQNVMVLVVDVNISYTYGYLQPLDGHRNIYLFNQGEQEAELVTYYIGKYGACPGAVSCVLGKGKARSVHMMADQCFPNLGGIISVGVACGIKNKTQLFDALVSSKVINYGNERQRYLPKGETITVSSHLLKLFTQPVQWPNDDIKKNLTDNGVPMPDVKCGTILSGPYFVGDSAIQTLINNFADKAIGIEMDGANLFVENHQITTTNAIIVKVVCGFGDAKSTESCKSTARLLSADLVHKTLNDPQAFETLRGRNLLRQMLRQSKNENLTIKVRHAKILLCGPAKAGKTSFSCLLRNQKHETDYISTLAGDAQQVLISEKVNVLDSNWISLDSKAETQEITKRLILKLQKKEDTKTELPGRRLKPPKHVGNSNTISNPVQSHKQTNPNPVVVPKAESKISADESASYFTGSLNKVDEKVQPNKKLVIEEEMVSYSDGINSPFLDNIPETWDLFTLLDTGGQPEFINMLPAINSSTDITFVVLNISDGKNYLYNLVTAQFRREGYTYDKLKLKYTNMHLIKSLLSSVKVASLKKSCFDSEVIRSITEDEQSQSVVCIIGTCADVLKVEGKYVEELFEINKQIRTLVEEIEKEDLLIFWCDANENYVNPIDNTIPRQPGKVMQSIQLETSKAIQRIREHSNEILRKKPQYEIPISWFILELELRNNDKVCIPLTEVEEICDAIMPSSRKMRMDQIKEILKFYHLYGMLLFFSEVEGMKNYVVTNPQWLFINLTKIIMCKFEIDANDLYGSHLIKRIHNGIGCMELFRKLNLNLQGVELESFVKLLVHLKVIAPLEMTTSQDGCEYFIPTVLPPCDARKLFTEKECGKPSAFMQNGECIHSKVEPLLIEFTFGTIPRGLFGFLIAQLLQDNPDTYKIYGKNDDILRRCVDLICFFIQPCYYVSLHDRISYLELQVRVKFEKSSCHYKVQSAVTKALEKVCEEFNWSFSKCHYGFLCRCCAHMEGSKGEHLTLLDPNPPYASEIPEYTICKYDQPTCLSKAHTIWFEDIHKILQLPASKSKVLSETTATSATSTNATVQSDIANAMPPGTTAATANSSNVGDESDTSHESCDVPTIKELSLNVINQYAAHWEDLGALLGLKPYKIANIARDHHNQSVDACRKMLMLWLQVDPSPTWGKLDAAIKSLKTVPASKPHVESRYFGLPHKRHTTVTVPEQTLKIKSTKLGSKDCVAIDNDSVSSDISTSSCVLIKRPLTSTHMTMDLKSKGPLSYSTSGSCDNDGGLLTSKYGDLRVTIPKGAIKDGDLVTLSLASDLYGPFVLPSKCQSDVVSPYYWIRVSGSYHFQKPVQVEFQHFAVVTACDPSHYQLLFCEDDDKSYTMQPAVGCNPTFTVQDNISWCTFNTNHFCSYCIFSGCEDPVINRIAAIYLKTKDYQRLSHFTAEIWFSLNISLCLRRNAELYEKEGMVLDCKCNYDFQAACDKNSTNYFTLTYAKEVNGWDLQHSRSTNIKTKEINFYNNYTNKEHLERNEDNSLFPKRFIVNVIKKPECNTDLNTEITIALYENEGKVVETIPFLLLAKMITNRPSFRDSVAQIRTTDAASTQADLPFDRDVLLARDVQIFELSEYVIPRVMGKWDRLAFCMRYEPSEVEAFRRDSQDINQCCIKLFSNWLETNHGPTPKTYQTLLNYIKRINDLTAASEVIERDLIRVLRDQLQ